MAENPLLKDQLHKGIYTPSKVLVDFLTRERDSRKFVDSLSLLAQVREHFLGKSL